MKKRIIALVIACLTVVALCACGGGGTAPATEAPAEAAEAVTEAAAEASEAAAEVTEAAAEQADATEAAEAAAEVEPFTFRFSYGGNSGSSMHAIADLLMEEMDKASGGAFTFETFTDPGYKEDQALDELNNDIVDIVYLASGSVSTNIPDVAYLGMPGCYRYTDDPDTFFDFESTIHDTMSAIYDNYGIHYLALRVPSRMVAIGKGEAPHVPSDLAGQIARVAGTWMGKLMVSLDIATATLGPSEIVTGLQRGTINTCITGVEQVKTNLIYEAADYCAIFPETDGIGSMVMDADIWNQLTDAQKAAVETAVKNWMQDCLNVSQDFTQQSIDLMDENNVEHYDITAEECDEWLAHLDDLYAEADAASSDLGNQLKDQIIEWNAKQK